MCLLGSYASMNDMFPMWVKVLFGVAGYALN